MQKAATEGSLLAALSLQTLLKIIYDSKGKFIPSVETTKVANPSALATLYIMMIEQVLLICLRARVN